MSNNVNNALGSVPMLYDAPGLAERDVREGMTITRGK